MGKNRVIGETTQREGVREGEREGEREGWGKIECVCVITYTCSVIYSIVML